MKKNELWLTVVAFAIMFVPFALALRWFTESDWPAHHRLIGYGCGPEKATYTAVEEDHFPVCERIEALR